PGRLARRADRWHQSLGYRVMPITCRCPGCKAPYQLAEHLAGKKVRCKKCEQTFPVPVPARAKEEPPAVDEVQEVLEAEAAREDGIQPSPRARSPAVPPRASDRRRPDERDERPRGGRPRDRRRDEGEDEDWRSSSQGMPVGLIVGIVGGVVVL